MRIFEIQNLELFIDLHEGVAPAVVVRGTVPHVDVGRLGVALAVVRVVVEHDKVLARVARLGDRHLCNCDRSVSDFFSQSI